MDTLVNWIHATAISQFIPAHKWVWPLCETLHFIGLGVLVGVAGVFDLRLLGFMKRVSIPAVMDFMPWAIAGFVINVLTGITFFVGAPEQYVHNRAFWTKVLFIALAGLNAIIFKILLDKKVHAFPTGEDTPWTFKVVAATSLFSWFAVIYFGRMLPYLGGALNE